MKDVPFLHELGNHRALPGKTVDPDRNKGKDVGVRYVLPKDSLLAEMLRPAHAS